MRPISHRLPDLRPALAILWGLALLWPGTPDVDRLRPLCVAAALSIGLAAWLRPQADALRPTAAFSLLMAGIMAWQPLYSTLGYSFLLNLHWQAWLLGIGLMGWQATATRSLEGARFGERGRSDRSKESLRMHGPLPAASGRVAGAGVAVRADRWERAAAVIALTGAAGLRLWPGAGMVERHGPAGLILMAWGIAVLTSLRVRA